MSTNSYLKKLKKIVQHDMDLEFLREHLLKEEYLDSICVYVPKTEYSCGNRWRDYINQIKEDFNCNSTGLLNHNYHGAYILYCKENTGIFFYKKYKILYIGMSGSEQDQGQDIFGRLLNQRTYKKCNSDEIEEDDAQAFVDEALCCRCKSKKLGVALLIVKNWELITPANLEKLLCRAYYEKNNGNPPAQRKCY